MPEAVHHVALAAGAHVGLPAVRDDGRQYLDVVTDLLREPRGPEPRVLSEIKTWAASYRDERYPGREIRYDWEVDA